MASLLGVITERPFARDSRATIGDNGATFRDSGATKNRLAPASTAGFSRPNPSNLMNLNNKGEVLLPSRFAKKTVN